MSRKSILWRLGIAIAVLAGGTLLFRYDRRLVLTKEDTVLLADFTNRTGEALFDDALKQGLAVQLEQSPLLNIFPDVRVQETLQLMGRPPDQRVTPEIARQICERQGLNPNTVHLTTRIRLETSRRRGGCRWRGRRL